MNNNLLKIKNNNINYSNLIFDKKKNMNNSFLVFNVLKLVVFYFNTIYFFQKYFHFLKFEYKNAFGYKNAYSDAYCYHDKAYQMYLKFKFLLKYFTIEDIDINCSILINLLKNKDFTIFKKILNKISLINIKDDYYTISNVLKEYLISDYEDETINKILINPIAISNESCYTNNYISKHYLYSALDPDCNINKFKLLLENVANINFKDDFNHSILNLLLSNYQLYCIRKKYDLFLEKINELFKYGLKIDKKCLDLLENNFFLGEKLLDKITNLEYYSI